MRKIEQLKFIGFSFALVIAVVWVRINIQILEPILIASTLFFQLIIAVTIIAFLRNIIGIKTFGVFGPTIIAFGIIPLGLIWGLSIYIDIFIVAMLTSLTLFPLGIPSSYRVAVIIAVTIIAITIFELLGELYHVHVLEGAVLFPVLITSWLADRFVVQVKEIDWVEPSKRLLGTFIVVIIAFLIMGYKAFVEIIALNPELWIVIIVINITLALKFNYRISEHFRFKPVMEAGGEKKDVLGLLKRNRDIIFRYNPRNMFPHTSKDKMKITMHQLGIPTPKTYALIQGKKDMELAESVMKREPTFVIKPARGLGGEGILVVEKNPKALDTFLAKGREYSINDLKNNISQILDGQYSSGWSDVAIMEEKVITHPSLDKFYSKGVPDIRIIVFSGFPIMAMTRLPTLESQGAANLHKGAIGMGLTISEGQGMNPFWRGHGGKVQKHPDTGYFLTDLKIQNWPELLKIAVMAQAASRLGYVGVDIVLDEKGPMVLEVNKRPGLEIQNTNLAGLLTRIEFVERNLQEHGFKSVSERVELSRKWDREGWQ